MSNVSYLLAHRHSIVSARQSMEAARADERAGKSSAVKMDLVGGAGGGGNGGAKQVFPAAIATFPSREATTVIGDAGNQSGPLPPLMEAVGAPNQGAGSAAYRCHTTLPDARLGAEKRISGESVACLRPRSKEVRLNGECLGHSTSWSDVEAILRMHGYRRSDPLCMGTEGPEMFEVSPSKIERVR